MNKTESEILNKIPRNDGMTVPNGFFDDFFAKMQNEIHDRTPQEQLPHKTVWLRLRPYVYMAAMFAGIYLMMQMFSAIRSPKSDLNINNYPTLTATLEDSDHEFIYEVNDYDVIEDIYNDGFSAEELFSADDDSIILCGYQQ